MCLKEAAQLQRARAGNLLPGLVLETDQAVSLRQRNEGGGIRNDHYLRLRSPKLVGEM